MKRILREAGGETMAEQKLKRLKTFYESELYERQVVERWIKEGKIRINIDQKFRRTFIICNVDKESLSKIIELDVDKFYKKWKEIALRKDSNLKGCIKEISKTLPSLIKIKRSWVCPCCQNFNHTEENGKFEEKCSLCGSVCHVNKRSEDEKMEKK